jgi:hypothetical protein
MKRIRSSSYFVNHTLQLEDPIFPPGSGFALLRGSDGFSLIITEIGPDSPTAYPTDFHIGFILDAPDEVQAKHKQLSDGGCQPSPIKSFEAMGSIWTAFYCPVGDGIDIEVNAHT